MTHIGEPRRVVTDVPKPIRFPRVSPLPEREPVPVRREPVPVRREPKREMVPGRILESVGLEVEKIPSSCPKCGRPLLLDETSATEFLLNCPEHGVVHSG